MVRIWTGHLIQWVNREFICSKLISMKCFGVQSFTRTICLYLTWYIQWQNVIRCHEYNLTPDKCHCRFKIPFNIYSSPLVVLGNGVFPVFTRILHKVMQVISGRSGNIPLFQIVMKQFLAFRLTILQLKSLPVSNHAWSGSVTCLFGSSHMATPWSGNTYALLALCVENPALTGRLLAKYATVRDFDVYFDINQNKLLTRINLSVIWYGMTLM